MAGQTIGVVLVSFGTAATEEDIPAYLTSVRGGRPAPPELVAEFMRRYRLVGGSPLLRITQQQAAALESLLNQEVPGGQRYRVVVGMRHAPPLVSEAFQQVASEGVSRVLALAMSPQFTPIVMGGYLRAIEEAKLLLDGAELRVAGPWHETPAFLEAIAHCVREALARLPPAERDVLHVLFTAHSSPRRVADQEPQYIDMLQATARAVAERVGLRQEWWRFSYQSAGYTPEPWLKPDVSDLFPTLKAAGCKNVLIAPVQFLADHMEVLYDIDVLAKEQARQAGLALYRTESLNARPDFIRALADVVQHEMSRAGWATSAFPQRFAQAIARIDAANAEDPTSLTIGGQRRPKELVHAEMLTQWVKRLRPEASEALLLAARAHHIQRWQVPRASYPEGRHGYLRWRTALHEFHARRVGEILAETSYDADTITRVQDLVRKRGLSLGDNPEVQALEDGLCLVFLQTQLEEISERVEEGKLVDVLRKTWRKMSPNGRELAQQLSVGPRGRRLLEQALREP